MYSVTNQVQNLNINGQTARYERQWKDVFEQRNLLKYARNIGKKWREVGMFLNLTSAQLDTFEMDNPGITTNAIFAMLNSFKNGSSKYGTPAQIEELADAFESAELMDLACDVRGFSPAVNQSVTPTRYPQQESMPHGASSSGGPMRTQPTQPVQSTGGHSGDYIYSVQPWEDKKEYEKLKNDHEAVYKMTASPRGVALIININNAAGFMPRKGSALDLNLMQTLFEGLDFEVITRQDLSADDMRNELSNISNPKEDALKCKLKAADCVVVFLMSHGEKDGIFTSDGRGVSYEEMFKMFQEKKSPYLVGKPVLFFIQACRGGMVDRGQMQADDATPTEDIMTEEEDTDNSDPSVSQMISSETADVLIAYSSVPGYKSYRNTAAGSWFVTQVAEVFSEYAKKEHLDELLTRVRRKVTECKPRPIGFQAPDKPTEIYKQCTETVSRLTKKLYFFPGMSSYVEKPQHVKIRLSLPSPS